MIRLMNKEDYKNITKWWIEADEPPPTIDTYPFDSTFIFEYKDIPVACISIYLTNTKEVAYLENLVANPMFKSEKRKQMVEDLIIHAENHARSLGYKRLICFSYRDKLKNRYEGLGYSPTVNDLTSFVKEL